MSDEFRRLLDEERAGSPLHSVLEAGLHDQPSPRKLAQAARALGIGAAGLSGALPAAAAGSARTLQASLFGFVKWGATGVLLGGVALSPLLRESPPSPSPSPAPGSSEHAVASARVETTFMPAPTPAASSGRMAATAPSFARAVSSAPPNMAQHPNDRQRGAHGQPSAIGERALVGSACRPRKRPRSRCRGRAARRRTKSLEARRSQRGADLAEPSR